MTPAGLIRSGLQLVSVATAVMAAWLGWVALTVLPSRDPGHVQVWAVVAVGSAALVALSILATRGAGAAVQSLLALLSIVAIAFGLLVSVSFLTTTASGDPEGYLVLIGMILTVHGVLGLAWTGVVALRSRLGLVAAGPGR